MQQLNLFSFLFFMKHFITQTQAFFCISKSCHQSLLLAFHNKHLSYRSNPRPFKVKKKKDDKITTISIYLFCITTDPALSVTGACRLPQGKGRVHPRQVGSLTLDQKQRTTLTLTDNLE